MTIAESSLHRLIAATLAAALACSRTPVREPVSSSATKPVSIVTGEHGKLAWFQGSYDELLVAATKSKKIIFLDFWASW